MTRHVILAWCGTEQERCPGKEAKYFVRHSKSFKPWQIVSTPTRDAAPLSFGISVYLEGVYRRQLRSNVMST